MSRKAEKIRTLEPTADQAPAKMKGKDYLEKLEDLQTELCVLQDWVKATGARIIIIFEGRDAAGKGGLIRALTERVSPRVFQVVALSAPSDREKSQLYIQRYLQWFPGGRRGDHLRPQLVQPRRRRARHGFCTPETTSSS
jgi:polyphosphate kinase 2 (PPK2 family)